MVYFTPTSDDNGSYQQAYIQEKSENSSYQPGDKILSFPWGHYVGYGVPATYVGFYENGGTQYPLITFDRLNYYLLAQNPYEYDTREFFSYHNPIPVSPGSSYPITEGPFNQVKIRPPTPACYLEGVRILTNVGEKAVELLEAGDLVATRFGGFRAIRWVGRQSFAARSLKNVHDSGHTDMPVRIRAGALSDDVPIRDLLVSADHSMLLDGYLVQARDLLNGITIVQEDALSIVSYYHIDLGTHDCVLADGAWSESYAEYANRHTFDNFEEYFKNYMPSSEPYQTMCAEQAVCEHPALPTILKAVVGRIDPLHFSTDPEVRLYADGKRIDPSREVAGGLIFHIQTPITSLVLASRSIQPLTLGMSADRRRLGFAVSTICVHDASGIRMIEGKSIGPEVGFHPLDSGGIRWTIGAAEIGWLIRPETTGTLELTIHGHGVGTYIVCGPDPSHNTENTMQIMAA